MRIVPLANRTLLVSLCLAVLVAACGGPSGPTTPSGQSGANGATIAGTVNRAGLTVAVSGTNLSTAVEPSGSFQIQDVPPGNVQLQFRDATVNATAQLSNVVSDQLIQLEVRVNGSSATIVNDVRSSGKVTLCHRTESGTYQKIEVSVSAEPAHRAHGDAKVGEPVPAEPTKVFDESCRPVGASVRIKKSTNGEDADEAPGPTITVGSQVTWRYEVTNTGTVPLTNVAVVDDRNVAVTCGQSSLAVGQSMTCTGSGVATLGQYRNVGTVTANSSLGSVRDSDPSHYLGRSPDEEEGPKIEICHRTGNGSYHLIEVSINAEAAHRAHGDAKIGEPVPGNPGKVFGAGCSVR